MVVENNGIGYQIVAPNPFSYSQYSGQEVIIYTYTYVREDIMALYGFQSREEKMLFTKLLNVSGMVQRVQLPSLHRENLSRLFRLLKMKMRHFLVKFPGVGKKTARQMILDLKGKLLDVILTFSRIYFILSLLKAQIANMQNLMKRFLLL